MTRLDSSAPADPRSKAALPDLRHKRGGVGGDVRAVLVDDPHDPERDADPLDAKPVRPHVALDDLAHGVGQGGHRAQARPPWPRPAASMRRSRSTTVGEAPEATERATSLAFALRISSEPVATGGRPPDARASSFAAEESVASSAGGRLRAPAELGQ